MTVRAIPRDGALLLFDPRSGTNALLRGPSTRHLRAAAPRVVMFGLTSACNLRCAFCSRDAKARNDWDEASAFEMLAGLAERGVLEVAFGGGEPLVFRGFDRLLARLRAETALAVHLTTNGVLLDDAMLARIRPHAGEIRLSIYDDNPWPERIAALAEAGGDFGANVLVTPDRMRALPALLARLEALGCPDVALLRYVGRDPALELDGDDLARLADIARSTSMRVRVSVCFGRALGLPVLETRGDCGAGRDFVVVGSDRTVRACSFGGDAISIETAGDIIAAWRSERERLSRSVPLLGCARKSGAAETETDGVRVWRAFSGNNSGECFLVGKFQRAAEAEAFVAELREGFEPGEPISEAWRARFEEEGIRPSAESRMPDTLEAVGRSVLVHTSMAPEDDFPEVRALAWKRGGRAVVNGIHEHDFVNLVTAIALDDARALEAIEVSAADDDLGTFIRRGDVLYGVRRLHGVGLEAALAPAREAARRRGLASAELVAQDSSSLMHALSGRPPEAGTEWLSARFGDPDRAARFAAHLGAHAAVAGDLVLYRTESVQARDGYLVSRSEAVATVLFGDELAIDLTLWRVKRKKRVPKLDAAALTAELRPLLRPAAALEEPLKRAWAGVHGTVLARDPLRALSVLEAFAKASGLECWLEPRAARPLEQVIARLDVDIRALRRERR